MIFDYSQFIEDLKQNPEKSDFVKEYEENCGPMDGDIQDQEWYKTYLSEFKTIEYQVPQDFEEDFDWGLLMKIVAWSFNSEWYLELENEITQFQISVQDWDNYIIKKVSELWGFQIFRLFEIFLEEQLTIYLEKIKEDKKLAKEKKDSWFGWFDFGFWEPKVNEIEEDMKRKIERWNMVVTRFLSKVENEQIEKEKQSKLSDLLSQL